MTASACLGEVDDIECSARSFAGTCVAANRVPRLPKRQPLHGLSFPLDYAPRSGSIALKSGIAALAYPMQASEPSAMRPCSMRSRTAPWLRS